MSNLPPGFRQHVEQLNLPVASQENEVDNEAEAAAVEEGRRTLSGIPLPVADTATATLLSFEEEPSMSYLPFPLALYSPSC